MNRIVNQAKRASRRDGKGIQWRRLILVAAILGFCMISSPGLLSLFGSVYAASGVEATSLTPIAPEQSRRAAAIEAYGKLPLSFEPNHGQTDSQVKFLSRGRGYKLFLTPTEAVLVLRQQAAGSRQQAKGKIERVGETGSELETPNSQLQTVLRMKLAGANPGPQIALEKLVGKVNYFVGNDPLKWRKNIPAYAKVYYQDVYPGVGLVYYGQQGQLEYDFIVSPGADPSAIRLAFEGVDKIEIDDQGDLVLSTGIGEIRLRKPLIYQDTDGAKQKISGGYVFVEANASALSTQHSALQTQMVGFQVAAYDVTKPLVIDPVLNYSTYLGGSGNDTGLGIAVDSAGNAYVTGSTDSTNFPIAGGVQGPQGGTDAFVTKISPDGSARLYSTYLGGSGNDTGLGIAVDSAGNAYVTGSTDSTNFPTSLALQFDQGGTDAFVTKLSSNGSALLYSTYLGGSGNDVGSGIAVDSAGNAYVAGSTNSSDFPMLNGVQGPQGGTDAFVTKLSSNGSALLYSTYLGGSGNDVGLAITVIPSGRAYITGFTDSSNFPMKKAFQGYQGGTDAFVTRLNAALSGPSSLLYSTYLGGSGNDEGHSIAVNSEGNTYITGVTDSTDFPMQNAIQGYQGGTDAFVTKVDPSLSDSASVLYSTFLGGSGIDEGNAIALDAAGNAYVTGLTDSPNFPIISGFATTLGGLQDTFVAKLAQPDLVNSGSSVPATGGAGSTISVSNTTKNQGAAAADASTTKFYLSTDTALDAGDLLLGSRAIPALAAGELSAGSTELAIPAETAAGSYYILSKVDADNSVAEAFEENNKSSRPIQIVHGPDLIVSALSTASSGSTITVTDTTKNQGVISAADSTTKFYLSTDLSFDAGDVLLGSRAIPSLAAGATSTASTTLTIPAGTAGGSYYIIAKADADSLVSEVNEGNNAKASGAFIVGPDLIVSTLFAPSTTGAGSTVIVSNTTKNQGVTSSGASTTKFYLSTDTSLDSADALLGSRAVAGLATGGTSVESTSLSIPAATTPGSYYIIAQADADGAVTESNEGNNTLASNAFTIGADLIVSALTAPSTGIPGSTVTVTGTTTNQGGGSAGASTTKFYLSTNTTFDATDIFLGSRAVPSLAPGAASSASTALTIPAGVQGGSYYVIAQADADNAVAEFNESNNTAFSTAISIGPDLIVSKVSAPPASGAGLTISVTDTTKNQGVASAGASTNKFYLSSDTILDSGDVLLGSRAIPALGPGVSDTGSATLTIPAATTTGSYYVIAQADADNAVTEFNEGNNVTVSSQAIAIGPDLIVWLDLPASSSLASTASTITINDVTKNDSSAQAGASTTKFYLSADAILDAGDVLIGSRAVPALAPGASSSASTLLTLPVGVGGTYYIIAKGDADNAVSELNEGNNITVTSTTIFIGPDLIVWLDIPDASNYPAAGATISITDQTRNDSPASAGPSTTKLYLSADATLDAGDILLGSRSVPALASGAINSGSTTFTLPPGIAGTYYFIAQADADNSVAETNEGNNITASKAIPVGADLIVWMDVPGSLSTVAVGSTIVVADWTRNDNSAPAGASTTKFYLSTDTTLDAGDILLGSRAIPALPASTTNSGSTTLTIPTGLAGGIYYVIAKADADNAVTEFNENNNIAVSAGTIFGGPDLIVWLDLPASATAAPLAAGSTISITDITKNDGTIEAGASTTKFYLSSDTTLDAGDIFLGSRAVTALAAGASSSVSTPLTLPVGIGGAYYIIAKADADNAVGEYNEGNNITVTSRTIFIGPDLIVWIDLPGTVSSAAPGSTLVLTDFTRNDSSSPAGASTTKFFLSTDTSLDVGDIFLGSRAVPALAAGAMDSGSTTITIPTGLAGGTYYIIAKADAENVVPEFNEGNNFTVSKPLFIGPDLIAWLDVPAASNYPAAGATISVTDQTKNDSFASAGVSTTKFYLSTDTTLDSSDILLGSRAVPALAPGEISSGSTTFILPAGIAGTYYVIAKADADNSVAETNEGNNITASKAIQIGADLIVWMDVPGSVVIAGSTIVIPDWTRNDNSAPAGASTTKFFLSTDTSLDAGDILVGSRSVPALPPSTTNSGSTSITIPTDWADGIYYIIARADADNAVVEFNENNNTAVGTIRISKEWRGPDLIVWLDLPASATAAPLAAGSTISITDITKNDGTVEAGASTTKFYLSSDTTLDAGDIPVGGRVVPPQGPGASSSVSTPLTLPAGVGGTYYIIAKADGDNVVAESNESNNITVSTRTIFIGPDLIVWLDLPGASTMVSAGSTISINDVTKNDSSAPAGASTTKFYLSSDTILDASDIPLSSRAIPALAPGAISSGSTPLTLPAGIAGTYYIIAQADGDSLVPEFNEGNNTTPSNPIAVGPDLVISGVTTGAMVPAQDGSGLILYINDTTKNKGAGSAGASTTTLYLSTDATLDPGDIYLGSRTIPALAALQYKSGTTAILIPAATPAGTYYIIALADGGSTVPEASETNNTFARLIEILPDLTVSTIAAPSKAYPGSTITVSDTTKNQGAGSSVSTTRFFLSSDKILDASDIPLGGRVVPALAPGGTSDGATSVPIPANLVAGTYYLIAMADADNAVAEVSETNNTRYKTLTVGPDLVVSVLSAPTTGVAGSTISITDTTTNLGSASGASTTKFYLSTNATLSSGDIFLGSRAIPALALQEANSGSTTITLPAGTVAGSYYIIAQADGDKAVAELVETNNTKARAITINQ